MCQQWSLDELLGAREPLDEVFLLLLALGGVTLHLEDGAGLAFGRFVGDVAAFVLVQVKEDQDHDREQGEEDHGDDNWERRGRAVRTDDGSVPYGVPCLLQADPPAKVNKHPLPKLCPPTKPDFLLHDIWSLLS